MFTFPRLAELVFDNLILMSDCGDDVYICDSCLEIFLTSKEFEQHEEKHSGKKEQGKSSKVKRIRSSSPNSEGESSDVDFWTFLSDEMVLYIFRLLPRKVLVDMSLLSRRFRKLSRDDSLWTELILDYEDIKQDADCCRKLVDRCIKLSSLKITDNRNRERLQIRKIMTVVSRAKETLKSLKVDESILEWTPTAMTKLGRLENLKSLTLTFSTDPNAYNSHAGANMLEVLAKLNKLEELKLSITYFYKRSRSLLVMRRVFQQLKKLKKVEMDIPEEDFDDSLVVAIAENNPELQVLRFENYHFISDRSLSVLYDCCPDLQELGMDDLQINLFGTESADTF